MCVCVYRKAFQGDCVEAEAATNTQRPHRSLIVCLHNKSNVSREIIYTRSVLNKWISSLLNSRISSPCALQLCDTACRLRLCVICLLFSMTMLVLPFFMHDSWYSGRNMNLMASWCFLCHWWIWHCLNTSDRGRGKENIWTWTSHQAPLQLQCGHIWSSGGRDLCPESCCSLQRAPAPWCHASHCSCCC